MTYHRDGSHLRIGLGKAHRRIRNYGWLTQSAPFPVTRPDPTSGMWRWFQRDRRSCQARWSKVAADRSRVCMTRGHHTCEFCNWESPDYGNGEIWLKLDGVVHRMPRMVWHYQEAHRYALPDAVIAAFATGTGTFCTDEEINTLVHQVDPGDEIPMPAIRFQARWKESRYRDVTVFSKELSPYWMIGPCIVREGYYCMECLDFPVVNPALLVEMEPEHFPDHITIDRVTS